MMPKSTATSRPVLVDEQVARVHVGVEEAVAQRVPQEILDHRAAEIFGRSIPAQPRAWRDRSAATPSIHSIVSTSRLVRSQSTVGTRNSGRPWCSPPSRRARRLPAADPFPSRPNAPASRRFRPGAAAVPRRKSPRLARGEHEIADRSRRNRPPTLGRSTLTATVLRTPFGRPLPARWTCAMEAAATDGPKLAKTSDTGLSNAVFLTTLPPPLAETAAFGPASFRDRAPSDADDVGPGGEKLAELDIGRAEPRQCAAARRPLVAAPAPLDQPRRCGPRAAPPAAWWMVDEAEGPLRARAHSPRVPALLYE
jgi:hypothetical protein